MEEHIAHSGVWGFAVIMIVLASWFLYRYLAPKSWREWAGAGVVQAFIIALYAEMYGFPLTIYLLVRFFGFDRTGLSANLWSSLLGVGELGMMLSMLLGYVFLFVGIGLFAQGWRELYRARQNNVLAKTGLYRFVRHPQYTGLFLGLFGEGVVHWPTLFSIILFPVIVVIYVFLARREERQVLEEFGEEYQLYRQSVPMFFPKMNQWRNFVTGYHAGTQPESNESAKQE